MAVVMKRVTAWFCVAAIFFVAVMYVLAGESGLMWALPMVCLLAAMMASSKFTWSLLYFFIGFFAGVAVSLLLAYLTNASSESVMATVLCVLPFAAGAAAVWYGSKTNYSLVMRLLGR